MKLAEALIERKAAQAKISELSERLQRVVLVQEGEQAAEEPSALLREIGEVVGRLESLITAINRTNVEARLPDGRSIMAAIAHRDVVRMHLGVVDALIRSAGNPHFRTRGSEIKFVATFDVAELQRDRDRLAKDYRQVDTAIQAANWSVDLIE
jgi:hypothetical protein